MEEVLVFQVTEDVLAVFSQYVIHHINGDVNIGFGVLVISSVVQLKSHSFKDKKKKGIQMLIIQTDLFLSLSSGIDQYL